MGIKCRVIPLANPQELQVELCRHPTITHVIMQAPWIPTNYFASLSYQFPCVQFAMVSHSNVGFLQADRNGIKLIKEAIELEGQVHNFHIGGNSKKFCKWVEETFSEPCSYLPNMYFLHHKHGETKRMWRDVGGTLKLGIFGATRSQKNIISAVGAAMEIANELSAHTQVWFNTDRDDGIESRHIRAAARELVHGLPNIELKELSWASWHHFKRVVGSMHLLLQPSYTESFNMVTADGAGEGVPSVVSSAIHWAPKSWQCDVDDVNSIAHVGMNLLGNPAAAREGFEALKHHNRESEIAWLSFLTENRWGNPL
jgi:hypothetical protein